MADTEDMAHMKRDQEQMLDLNDGKEDYPYGLRLRLTEEDMTKLGLEMPAVGGMVHIAAMTKVISSHASDDVSSGASHGVELQITHMCAECEDDEDLDDEDDIDDRTPAEKIYGKK